MNGNNKQTDAGCHDCQLNKCVKCINIYVKYMYCKELMKIWFFFRGG